MHHEPAGAATELLSVPLGDVFCPCCRDDLGSAIRKLPYVVAADLDLERAVALVTVHAGATDVETLRTQIASCNFRNPVPLPRAEVRGHRGVPCDRRHLDGTALGDPRVAVRPTDIHAPTIAVVVIARSAGDAPRVPRSELT